MEQKKGLEPSQKPDLTASERKELEKRCLAVVAQCMEILTLGGPQLDDLLRTVLDRQTVHQPEGPYAHIWTGLISNDKGVNAVLEQSHFS